jgi:ABC-type polysaccharide/polyol phosphate export permease
MAMSDPAAALENPARYRWLLASFVKREIIGRYAGSVSGLAWTLLHPLAQLALFAFVFSTIFRARVPAEYAGVGYTAFVAVALWPWLMFVESLQRGMGSIGANASLIRKVAFPHRLVVYASVIACYAVHGIGFVVVLVALRLAGEAIHLEMIPVAALLLVPYLLLATGLAAALAALQTLLKDVEQVIGIILTMLFYATPILYPVSFLPEGMRPWVQNHPFAYFSERLRDVLLNGSGLATGDFVAAVGCVLVFLAGVWIFERLSPHFEDFL